MIDVHDEALLDASVDEVWAVVGDFGGVMEALRSSVTVEGSGVGAIRRVHIGLSEAAKRGGLDGATLVERLEELDPVAHRIAYSVIGGPLPVRDHRGEMHVQDAGDGRSLLVWTARFAAVGDEQAAGDMIRSGYANGLARLREIFASTCDPHGGSTT